MSNPKFIPPHALRATSRRDQQRGVSLVELLVGVTIGLLVIAAAIGTLIISRTTSSTVTDVSQLQQQGSYALRVMGLQMRQAGSLELTSTFDGFEFINTEFVGIGGSDKISVSGIEGGSGSPDEVTVSNHPSSLAQQARDCLGNSAAANLKHIDSRFFVENNQLYCLGTNAGTGKQPIISNVNDFQVRYRIQKDDSTQLMNADEISTPADWRTVSAIETCLDLQGNDSGLPESGNYINCQGASTARNGRLHLVLRNVFDLRIQQVTP